MTEHTKNRIAIDKTMADLACMRKRSDELEQIIEALKDVPPAPQPTRWQRLVNWIGAKLGQGALITFEQAHVRLLCNNAYVKANPVRYGFMPHTVDLPKMVYKADPSIRIEGDVEGVMTITKRRSGSA